VVSFALPRIVVAGLSGDCGKTLVAAGLARAYRRRGLHVAPFKKGPDYIDPAWLAAAAGRQARNLDTFLMPEGAILRALEQALNHESPANIAIIEGNRGLFDGFDAAGTHSTAELAKRIRAPLVLVVDVRKSTRTIAAFVLGCMALDPALPLAGVILNRVGSARQERLIREAITQSARVPVLGALPRLAIDHLPSRHLGLVMPGERTDCEGALEQIADAVEHGVDLDSIQFLADEAPRLPCTTAVQPSTADTASLPALDRPRIGVLRDQAFSFYYPENLAALEAEGAELVGISPLHDTNLPAIDALYAGGGYPEEHAALLAANVSLRAALASRIAAGMPVWAECGGLMYLASALHCHGQRFPMVGALPIEVEQTSRPQGHGYAEARVDAANPFLPTGTQLRGHEFHYSRIREGAEAVRTVLSLATGTGIGHARDGIVAGRVFASYLHLFAPGAPAWAPAFIHVAREARAMAARQPIPQGDHRGIHNGQRRADRNRRVRLHSGACQVE
jgi:cobyrinic acid a,c-diamide synthase